MIPEYWSFEEILAEREIVRAALFEAIRDRNAVDAIFYFQICTDLFERAMQLRPHPDRARFEQCLQDSRRLITDGVL